MLSLDTLKMHQQTLLDRVEQAPLQSALIYFAVYVLVSALSIPGAALLTLLGGAIFNLWEATLLVSLASTLGATLALLDVGFGAGLTERLERRLDRRQDTGQQHAHDGDHEQDPLGLG